MTGRQGHGVISATALKVALLHVIVSSAAAAISSWEPRSDDDYHVYLANHMHANMHLSCYAVYGTPSRSEFYHSFRADPGREDPLPFLHPAPGRPPLRVVCKWAYDGNYMRGVTLFSTAWPEAGACRLRNGGCMVVFEDREMFIVERARRGRGRLLGDVPIYECEKMLLVFYKRCWYKDHRHPYVGRVLRSLTDYMMA